MAIAQTYLIPFISYSIPYIHIFCCVLLCVLLTPFSLGLSVCTLMVPFKSRRRPYGRTTSERKWQQSSVKIDHVLSHRVRTTNTALQQYFTLILSVRTPTVPFIAHEYRSSAVSPAHIVGVKHSQYCSSSRLTSTARQRYFHYLTDGLRHSTNDNSPPSGYTTSSRTEYGPVYCSSAWPIPLILSVPVSHTDDTTARCSRVSLFSSIPLSDRQGEY